MSDERRVVVIGTGPCGAMAAEALHRAGIAVTVLDAGIRNSSRGLTVRAGGVTVFRMRRGLPATKAGPGTNGAQGPLFYSELSAGGLSNHWTCAVPRFAPEDFTDGERLGPQYRWPISYSELKPFYEAAEGWLRIAGCAEDVPSMPGGVVAERVSLAADWKPIELEARARGQGVAALPLAYGGSATTVTASGTVFNSYVRILESIERSERFRVIFGARVLRLEWSGEERGVTRVVYSDVATGTERAIEASAVVVAAGALNSTRLLLQSTSPAFPAGLGNTEGVLGRYLHDHPLGKLELQLEQPLSIHPPVMITREPYGTAPPLRGAEAVLWSSVLLRAKSLIHAHPDRSAQVGFSIFGTIPPEPKHCVRLSKDRCERDGSPALELEIGYDEATTRLFQRTREQLRDLLSSAGFAGTELSWKVEPIGTSVHYGGSVRMHDSPALGMLDRWNRLHAVPNVLVVDSSAFTTGPEKNPTLTAMALSLRACGQLARDLAAG